MKDEVLKYLRSLPRGDGLKCPSVKGQGWVLVDDVIREIESDGSLAQAYIDKYTPFLLGERRRGKIAVAALVAVVVLGLMGMMLLYRLNSVLH